MNQKASESQWQERNLLMQPLINGSNTLLCDVMITAVFDSFERGLDYCFSATLRCMAVNSTMLVGKLWEFKPTCLKVDEVEKHWVTWIIICQ